MGVTTRSVTSTYVDSERVGAGRTLRLFRDSTSALSVHWHRQAGTRPYRRADSDEINRLGALSTRTHVKN